MADERSNISAMDIAVAQNQLVDNPSQYSSSEGGETTSSRTRSTAKNLMDGCPYPVALNIITTSLWGVPSPPDANEAHVTTWVAKTIHDYNLSMAWDNDLFADYLGDYEGWTKEMFLRVECSTLRSLKFTLRHRGVNTGNNRARITDSLCNLLSMQNPPEWDPVEFQAMEFDNRSKAYKLQQGVQQTTPAARQQPLQPILSGIAQVPQPLQQRQGLQQEEPNGLKQGIQSRYQTLESRPQRYQNIDNQQSPYMGGTNGEPQSRQPWHLQTQIRPPATTCREVTPFPQQLTTILPIRQSDMSYDPYKTLPPRWSCNDKLDARKVTQFSENWENNKKYTGDVYDLVDDKIKAFFNLCWRLDIKEEQFHAVFPTILTGRAEMFYMQVVERDDSFASAYTAIKNHFDREVHYYRYYTDWKTTTFARTRTENPNRGLREVLQILLDKLQLCQRALGKNFEGEDSLCTTVINACCGVRELEMALFEPATTCEELFLDLRSSIETHLARRHRTQTRMGIEAVTEDQYYLDRRYNRIAGVRRVPRGTDETRGGFRGDQRSSIHNHGFHGNDSRRTITPRWKKKCFVCQKEGCWSTNHTDEQFIATHTQFFSICHFMGVQLPKDFAVNLAEYEGSEASGQQNQEEWREHEEYEDEEEEY